MSLIGIAFPFTAGQTSFPAVVYDDDVIAQNIIRCIHTRLGERVMRGTVGSQLNDFTFENSGPVLRARIEYEIRRAIAEGEPRASVWRVVVTEGVTVQNATVIQTEIYYEVNRNMRTLTTSFSQVS